jgi:hypothetical protein
MPKPYNHPVRTVRVGRGARPDLRRPRRLAPTSSTRRARGFGPDPQTREMWAGRSARGQPPDQRGVRVRGQHWSMLRRASIPAAAAATPADLGSHVERGRPQADRQAGLGLCSLRSASRLRKSSARSRSIVRRLGRTRPFGKYVHNQASTFTMALCSNDEAEARAAPTSRQWYPKAGARLSARSRRMAEGSATSAPTPTPPTQEERRRGRRADLPSLST